MDRESHLMTCEEFQILSLHLRSQTEDAALQQSTREHLQQCAHCAAFQNTWLDLKSDLHLLGAENQNEQAPPRVEMRLRQEFRTKHKTLKARRNTLIATWAFAAAALIGAVIGWMDWRLHKNEALAKNQIHSPKSNAQAASVTTQVTAQVAPAGPELGEVLVASKDSGEFTVLPESLPGFLGDATVVHVQMQRGALGALGLTVNEEHAGDWIKVDLLLGGDGQPQAVRLPRSSN
jgi:anti-sigma factor RsiW